MPWYICVWVGENLDSVFLPVLAVGDIDAIIFVYAMQKSFKLLLCNNLYALFSKEIDGGQKRRFYLIVTST